MTFDTRDLARQLGAELLQRHWRVGTAESCTGGMVAAAVTDIAGSSGWFDEGLVTYANSSKERLLQVSATLLSQYGAVSQPVVEAMVAGVLARGADLALATSGVAGPDGGTADKPVGTVWFAWGSTRGIHSEVQYFSGDRQAVRDQATIHALQGALEHLSKSTV
ncbi:CinA family protein [Pseudomaricurvus sp. HS19]|uniref:CinA family protein n=1 Tax=Pseudomaricurvus sp. HS19 TaxID=2692626 RepID=UPI00136E26AE|nr:CinA family protein [Pseudomaricurvus sp. HS19]MYM65107.1 nicotinamide-nucleotide amidohydrolase family protein [Pseudomaricurvus sp. HS19]